MEWDLLNSPLILMESKQVVIVRKWNCTYFKSQNRLSRSLCCCAKPSKHLIVYSENRNVEMHRPEPPEKVATFIGVVQAEEGE